MNLIGQWFSVGKAVRSSNWGLRGWGRGMIWAIAGGFVSMASPPAWAQQVVIIDEWITPHDVRTSSANNDPNPISNTVSTPGGDIVGGERDIFVERITSDGATGSLAENGILDHNESSSSRGISEIVWDGLDGDPGRPVFDSNNNIELQEENGEQVPTGGLDPTGLGGLDLTSCETPGISFTVQPDNNNTFDLTVEVYTSASAWSQWTQTIQPDGNEDQIVASFPLVNATGQFEQQGDSNTVGASFDDVGAIRILLAPEATATDVNITSPIAACGFDFGDAPDVTDGNLSGTPAYETLVFEFDGRDTDVNEGAHHAIGGPWLPQLRDDQGNLVPVGSNDTDAENDGQQSTAANGDDTLETDDEQAVRLPELPDNTETGASPPSCDGFQVQPGEYCAEVRVANPTNDDAQLVAWLDFDADGRFNNDCTSSDGLVSADCERSAAAVVLGSTGLADFDGGTCANANDGSGTLIGGTTFTSGNVPAKCEGVVVVTWDLTEAPTVTPNQTYSRFRITTSTDRGFFGAATITDAPTEPAPFGFQADGEVEDHVLDAGTLPVSIHAFESRFTPEGLVVEWGTVSETRNAGFYLWGDLGNGPELLLDSPIQSRAIDSVSSQRYEATIPGLSSGAVRDLVITAVDTEGNEEVFGLFEPGKAYGRKSAPEPLAWGAIRDEVSARLAERRAAKKPDQSFSQLSLASMRGSGSSAAIAVDLRVSSAGMQEITWRDLADAGLDLTGVPVDQIAVTLKGEPVPRHIVVDEAGGPVRSSLTSVEARRGSTSAKFGPGSRIRFWGRKPAERDALYVDDYIYRIQADAGLAVDAREVDEPADTGEPFYLERQLANEDIGYSFTSPLDDPWYAARLRADTSNNTYSSSFKVDTALVTDRPAQLDIVLAGGNNSPTRPNHHARIEVNGQLVDDVFFTGFIEQNLSFDLPAGLIQPGANNVTVAAPGGTDAQFDIIHVDRLELHYPRRLEAVSDRLQIERAAEQGGVTAHGFTTLDTVAYAWDGEALSVLERTQFSRGSVQVPTVQNADAQYWISAESRLNSPVAETPVFPNQLLDGAGGDLLIVAHPAFLPLSDSEPHPLNDYIANRAAAGWNPVVFDIQQIQTHYGHGMPLPDALNRFLQDADAAFEFEHVLLVGSDSYDYTDNFELGSVSFIPTHYAETRFINYTPSDALLADLDGDGLSDKALGRWPVRTMADLEATVTKTLDWADGSAQSRSAVWVTDSEDPSVSSFRSQAERMFGLLTDAGWPESQLDGVFWADVEPEPGVSVADAARAEFFDLLEQGRSLTGFSGHGAPSMWTFQGLLTPDDISALHNEGSPTLIGTMTCYTSYFVSPFTDTVAHRWMNGYREDGTGNQIPGVPNGAVAIHGAATLSNYAQNEVFARNVLDYQLDGLTLGEAVQRARVEARSRGIEDLVINWTLLGDPTLRLDGVM